MKIWRIKVTEQIVNYTYYGVLTKNIQLARDETKNAQNTNAKKSVTNIHFLIFTEANDCNVVLAWWWPIRIKCIVAVVFSGNALPRLWTENTMSPNNKKKTSWSNYKEKVSHEKTFNKQCCMCNEWTHCNRIMKKKLMLDWKSVTKQTKRPFECRVINQTSVDSNTFFSQLPTLRNRKKKIDPSV